MFAASFLFVCIVVSTQQSEFELEHAELCRKEEIDQRPTLH